MKIDHHVHTERHSPDSVLDVDDLIDRALEVGLDGVVITEHDILWPEDELRQVQDGARARGLLILNGVEVSALEGHFLVYGLTHLDGIEPGIPLGDLLVEVRDQGAAIVAAHPFRWGQEFDEVVKEFGPVFHGLELVSKNVTPETRAATQSVLARTGMAATGSSDSHEVETLGCYHSEILDPVRTMADFVHALKRGRMRPRHDRRAFLASGPVG
jgi:predicted metal-dependent phosphoesterase TrpH